MTDDKKRLAAIARGVQALRRQSRGLREEIDFLDRFSERLPARACAGARSYLTMIEHGAELALAQVEQLRAELGQREAESRLKRLEARLGARAGMAVR